MTSVIIVLLVVVAAILWIVSPVDESLEDYEGLSRCCHESETCWHHEEAKRRLRESGHDV